MNRFDIRGDLPRLQNKNDFSPKTISCVICSARPSHVLRPLLHDLTQQSLQRKSFEVLLCDNSLQGHASLLEEMSPHLNINHIRETSDQALLGEFKNALLKSAQGEIILFLDDDTRLVQKDFLATALHLFSSGQPDIVLPKGEGLPLNAPGSYNFLDPFSFANRCCLYRTAWILSLGGFYNDLTAYEDIDLAIRSLMAGARIIQSHELRYQHSPLFFDSLKKPLAIGQSILTMRRHYPFYIWVIVYLNALRLLLCGLVPTTQNRQWFKIAVGTLLAPWQSERHTYRP